ncbi:succinate dehydrogenase, cytochrome b556 subunit [Ferrovibrio terrae]|jgi:succinate dehydrogenase / fumarate reductase cytochrome b subunit|uniref:Succinate dehydrogenase cytochrome b556 subunit n=1 Tax=Ferrovibrio terrae TaxID=2594003 RepID=A0A516GY94_9PROT|nr:succinate dehydrogenase, cytochrome b556 subunit [Ferrovibrio terrae]QDO96503.1 succinate dehydrogenase, cytochrome b556 subunit [Ferrovibrio terrae]
MANVERPLSPHLQIYRWPVTMATSILHRATGCGLAAGTLLLAWWLVAAAAGPEYYAMVQACLGSWLGRLVLLGFSWALFYHLLNGIRHLFWDAGHGYSLPVANKSGWAVIIGSVVLTVLAWILAYSWK